MSNFEDQPRVVREEVPAATVRPAVDARPVIEAQPLGARTVVEPQVVVEPAATPVAAARVVQAPVVESMELTDLRIDGFTNLIVSIAIRKFVHPQIRQSWSPYDA